MTIVKALQGLYVETGGTLDDRYSFIASNAPVGDYKRAVDCLKAVYMLIGGSEEDISSLSSISSLIYEIGEKGIVVPEGTLEISVNGDYDVTEYAQAKVQTPVPTGTVEINANGTGIDVAQYATADIAVPQPNGGKITLTQNATDVDIWNYETADVAVPQPTGKITITDNGTDIDVSQYATADVNVTVHLENFIDLIEGDVVHFDVPDGTTRIKNSLFSNDTTLEEVTLPNSLQEIGQYAFTGCTGLHTINFDTGLRYISQGAFSGSGLTTLNIPHNSGVNINNDAFRGCTSLTTVTIDNSISGFYAFGGCTHLTTVEFKSNATATGANCFNGCTRLSTIIGGENLVALGSSCFENCTSLTSLTINGSSSINSAFVKGCSNLTTLYILATSIHTMNSGAFTGNTSLTDIYFAGSQATWESYNVYSVPSGCTVHYDYVPA